MFFENMQANLQSEIQKQVHGIKTDTNQQMDQLREDIRSMLTDFAKEILGQLKELQHDISSLHLRDQHLAEMFGRHELELKQLKDRQ
ncbi:hypothetical protein LLE49_09055 [Alicyclobacillus tolerans]|uniref:hypothetical protein n=1 Tax=Alicyclobacillus tolerans TaxID=90970 RepID=UPI001F3C3FE1|nr:hypothetical protein [Alicyclobacillus tolerans]MCF8564865.1 hypothetical protein [Alicyclobacillus tolerans]